MFSGLKKYAIYILLWPALSGSLLAAAAELPSQRVEPFLENYPEYPPTKPASGEEAALIQRGEYIAKAGDCIACHSNVKENMPAFAGGLSIKTPFGVFHSPNITPDKETGIGNWTEADFVRAMTKGQDPQGRNYFPVFPYIYFAKTKPEDLHALYTYLMSIPPVKQKNKALSFPFNMPGARFSLWGWNLLFFYPDSRPFVDDPKQSPTWNRGKYLVDGLGHCSMCHTPLNPLGAPKMRYYLTGGFVDDYWAPNITKYGLASATEEEVADVFIKNELINNAGPISGPMAEVNHNSLNHLTPEDRMAIASYLKTVVSEEPLMPPPASGKEPSLKRGHQVYTNVCTICHQEGKMGAPLMGNGAGWFMRLKDSGLTGLYRHTLNGYNSMPVKGACVTCSENDLISAVDYILHESLSRSQWEDLRSGGANRYPANGRNIYNENCSACHSSGQGGAPVVGDTAAWEALLLEQNMDVLILNTINGKNHPKNGGCKHCTTREVIEAIKYMVSQSKTSGNYTLW